MKLTLDTNVLVSAFVSKQGHPGKLIDVILAFPEIRLALSEPILLEFRDVMMREEVRERFGYSAKEVESFVEDLRRVSNMVTVKSRLMVVKEDHKDDIVINTAIDANSDFIVSGDSHLQKMKRFRRIKIVNPRQMIEMISSRFGELIITRDEIRKSSA